jgi:hypothetical protein
MSRERIALDLATWLDSQQSARLTGLDRAHQRSALEQLLRVCYEELGKAPHLLEGDEFEHLLVALLPARFGRRDEAVPRVPALLAAWLDHLEEQVVVPHAFELRQALERASDTFVEAARSGHAAVRGAPAGETIVHRAPRLGRNDPCWCGSGRKFKKCHGRPG